MSVDVHYRVDGPAGAEALVLGPSLGTSLAMWDEAVRVLAHDRRVLRYDLPGHSGLSDVDYTETTVGDIAAQVLAIADGCGVRYVDYAGVSLGGAVGQWIALHHPHRLRRLAVVCSSAHFGPELNWRERAELVASQGMAALVEPSQQRWFAPGFPEREPERTARLLGELRQVGAHGYRACCAALGALDLRERLGEITAPTLVIAGEADAATPVPHSEELAAAIPGARLEVVADAGHLANVEQPDAVTDLLRAHLDGSRTPAGSPPTSRT